MAKVSKKKTSPQVNLSGSQDWQDGYKAGMMRAHSEMLERATSARDNNSAITYVGLERIAWDFHNLAKDHRL